MLEADAKSKIEGVRRGVNVEIQCVDADGLSRVIATTIPAYEWVGEGCKVIGVLIGEPFELPADVGFVLATP